MRALNSREDYNEMNMWSTRAWEEGCAAEIDHFEKNDNDISVLLYKVLFYICTEFKFSCL